MSGVAAALGWALLHSLWQLVLVGAGAALLLKAAGPGRPKAQYRLAYSSLVACLALPVLTFVGALAPIPVRPLVERGVSGALASAGPGLASAAGPAPWTALATSFLAGHLAWISAVWCLGAMAMGLRLGGGWLATLSWRRQAVQVPQTWSARFRALAETMGAGSRVVLLGSTKVASPVALGLWRPVVLVPAALFSGLPQAYLEALLAHELAHVARLDYLANLGQCCVEVLCFHHPVVWWLSGRVRQARERLCDERAAMAIGEPRRLALALDALDDLQPMLNPMALAARGGPLYDRIRHLLNPPRPTRTAPWALALVLALALPCGAWVARSQAEPLHIGVRAETVAMLDALALKEGLEPQLLRSLAWAESWAEPKAKSRLGALGILQVMPETARKYGAADLGDPGQVAAAGARYLKFLLARYDGDVAKAVAAYNCGEEALDAGQVGPVTAAYRSLVLELLRTRVVQPEAPLGEGCLEGTFRPNGDGRTWTVAVRMSHRGDTTLDFLPEVEGDGARPYATVRIRSQDAVPGPWVTSHPKVTALMPGVSAVRVRCSCPGFSGVVRVPLDGAWNTFALQLEPTH